MQRERARAALAQPATGLALLVLAHELFQPTTADASPQTVAISSEAAGPRRSDKHGPWAVKRMRKLQQRMEDALEASQQPHADPEQVHRARILAKRTRYAAEMLRDLLPAKRTKALTQGATAVQTQLGLDRDLQQAVRLLGTLQADPRLIEFLRGVVAHDAIAGGG